MHILITGGAGFIGSNLTEYHLAQGHQVHVIDDLSTGALENISSFMTNPKFHFDQDDMLSWDGLEKAVNWADRIYHLAAVVGVFRVLEDPVKVMAINIAATERLLRLAHLSSWRPQILIASTSEVYGHGLQCQRACALDKSNLRDIEARSKFMVKEFREDMEPMVGSSAVSRWNYAISKLADEALGISYAREYGSPITVGRFFNTIGPRQRGRYGMVVPRFIDQARSGKPITVFGDGTQMRSFCDVRDNITILDQLMNNEKSHGQIVNVGNNREISIIALAELVKALAGSSSVIDFIPYEKAYKEEFQETLCRKPCLDKLYSLIDYRPKWTLEDTIKDLLVKKQS